MIAEGGETGPTLESVKALAAIIEADEQSGDPVRQARAKTAREQLGCDYDGEDPLWLRLE